MDKQINRIAKDLKKGQKDTKKLLKMDHVRDKERKEDKMKIHKCEQSCSSKSSCKGLKRKR